MVKNIDEVLGDESMRHCRGASFFNFRWALYEESCSHSMRYETQRVATSLELGLHLLSFCLARRFFGAFPVLIESKTK